MPIYEYLCENCHKTTEVIQKFSDPPFKDCPFCHGQNLTKITSKPSFHLKGSGWYKDSYSSPKDQSSSPADLPNASKPDSAKPDSAKQETPPPTKEVKPEQA